MKRAKSVHAGKKNVLLADAPPLKIDCETDELRLSRAALFGAELILVRVRGEWRALFSRLSMHACSLLLKDIERRQHASVVAPMVQPPHAEAGVLFFLRSTGFRLSGTAAHPHDPQMSHTS